MTFATLCLALCPVLAQPLPGGPSAAPALPDARAVVANEAALLVPEDAFVLVRFESAEALLVLVQAFAKLSEEDVPADAAALLENLEVPGDRAQIDPARPAWMAFSIGQGSPLATAVLPTRDAQAYVASLAGTPGLTTAVSGTYVGFSMTSGYALRSAPDARVEALRPGLVSAHVDLGSLIQTYRPMIEMGLDQVEMMMDQMSDIPDSPMDMGVLLEVYMDGIWAFVDSAQGLDLTLDYDGRSLSVRSDLSTKPKSPMAEFGGEASHDLRSAARYLDPASGMCMVAAYDWAQFMQKFGPVLDAVLSAYPEPLATDLKRYTAAYSQTLAIMGPLTVASGDFAAEGLRLVYSLPSQDPNKLTASIANALGSLAGEQAGSSFKIAVPQAVSVGKVQALRSRLSFDMQALVGGLGANAGMDAEQLESLQALLVGIYGAAGMDLTMGALADRMITVMGGDAAYAERSFAAAPTKFEDLPLDLQRAIDAADGSSTAFVYRIDYGQIMGHMGALFAQMGMGELAGLADLDTPFPITFWMGIRGSTWSGGTSFDMQNLAELVESVKAALPAPAPTDEAEEQEDL